jgi:cellulose synthase/poly-beta-1,6-N-acetylglucosamine synthase-like glycosyltransferase
MINLVAIVFWFCLALVAHTYLIYPLWMIWRYKSPSRSIPSYERNDSLPTVAILIAAYNEEKVIEQKIRSVLLTDYPFGHIEVLVGSDASSDNTDAILKKLANEFPNIRLQLFSQRSGKINIVNQLQSMTEADILFLTDANVMFNQSTIYELVKYFKDDEVGIVASNIVKQSNVEAGITYQEKKYLSLENKLKTAESNAYGIIIGAEGGCYAIRNSLFSRVPIKFNVDDFFITMQVIARGKKTLFNPNAICFEDVDSDPSGEYRRKVRISSGNFQNLLFFRTTLYAFWKPLGFMFLSHKVLRWLTPFFLMFTLFSSILLRCQNKVYLLAMILQVLLLLTVLLDRYFGVAQKHIRFISHFYMMNLALLVGFIRFTRGIKSSIWQPVKRNV